MQTLPKTTLHDPFLTMLIDNVCLAGYFLSYHTKILSKGGFSTGVLRSTPAPVCPQRRTPAVPLFKPLMVSADCPSTVWLAIMSRQFFFLPILSLLFALECLSYLVGNKWSFVLLCSAL